MSDPNVLPPPAPVRHGVEAIGRLASTPSSTSTPTRTLAYGPETGTDHPTAQPALRHRPRSNQPPLRLLLQNVQGLAKNWTSVSS
jgi:hypothetical protein